MNNQKGFRYYLINSLILFSCLLIIGYAIYDDFKSMRLTFSKLKGADQNTLKSIVIALIIYLLITEIIYFIFYFIFRIKDKKQGFDFRLFRQAGTASVGIMLLGGFLIMAFRLI